MNPYEAGEQKVIPAVLVYLMWENEILMIHRFAGEDIPIRIWNGLGGKCELNESPSEAAKREVFEEAEIDLPVEAFKSLGVLHCPHFKPKKKEDWMVFVFYAKLENKPRVPKQNHEGELEWVPETSVINLNLWPADRQFIPYVLSRTPFLGSVWYQNGEPSRTWFQALGPHPVNESGCNF